MLLTIDGNETYCYTGGKTFDATLPTVVFIHGAQNDHSVWILQTRYFAHHGFGVLAIDLPGHGRREGAALTSIEAMAEWTLRMLDAAGVQQASLIGHSMGSLVALEAASKSPARITKLALVGAAFPMKVSDSLLDAALNDEKKAIDMVNIWSHSSVAQKPSFPGPGCYTMGGAQRLMQAITRQGSEAMYYTNFAACNAYSNGEAAAQEVICPTLFLMGKRDMMTPLKATTLLTKAIPHARIVQLEHCGHALMMEQPDAVLDNLYEFLAC